MPVQQFKRIAISCVVLLSALVLRAADEDKIVSRLPPLPQDQVLSASLFYHDKWYAMSRRETEAVMNLLKGKPYYYPKDVRHVVLPAAVNKIILWTAKDTSLVPKDVIKFGYRVNFLYSVEQGNWFSIHNEDDRAPLLELVQRIEEGTEKPLYEASKPRSKDNDDKK